MIQQHKKIEDKTIETASNTGSSANTVQLKNNREYSVIQQKLAESTSTQPASFIPVQRKINNTGLPNNLKSGIENLSGHSMDDVTVHYNSDKPAQLNAHAYAQGTDIHIASGQEKHLPHEAWHAVQQKQGRVKPTLQMKSKVNVNDDKGLEKEADVMGAKALTIQKKNDHSQTLSGTLQLASVVQRKEVTIGEQTFDTDDSKAVWINFYKFQEEGDVDSYNELIRELSNRKALSKRLRQKWRKLENDDLRNINEPVAKRKTKKEKARKNQAYIKPIEWESKPTHKAVEESEVTKEEVTAYKEDVEKSLAWGTIDQAKALALKYFMKFDVYIPAGNGNIRRTETIGKGRSYGRALYFQGGNHFQVIIRKKDGAFNLINSDQKFALNSVLPRSDGSCLYDACYIIRYNRKANDLEIGQLRKYAARNTPTKAIKSEIRDLKSDKRNGRKIFGLGPEMKKILKSHSDDEISSEDLAIIHALFLEDMQSGVNTYQKEIELFFAGIHKEKKKEISSAKDKKKDLMVVGSHMSGDMYGVAAALALKPTMSVLVVTDNDHQSSETAMINLFKQTIGESRVYIEKTANANTDWHTFLKSPGEKYKNFHTVPVTSETAILAESFKNDTVETYKTIKNSWIGTNKQQLEKEEQSTIKFLAAIGMPPGNYALLWSKTGSLNHPHPQHYSSASSQNHLINQIRSMGWTPVNIGDDVKAEPTKPSLIKFWENEHYPLSFKNEGRKGQLKMLYFISRLSGYNLVNVGMRSGILEGPALIGLKVIYLEERGNAQAERWEKLLGNVPSFKRVLLDTPPGGVQKKHWIERILWRNYKSEILQDAKEKIATIISAEPNQVMGILLDHDDLKNAVKPLTTVSKLSDKTELETTLKPILSKADEDFQKITGGKEKWVQEQLNNYKTKAAEPETGEGLSVGELGAIKHLLVSWNDAPVNSKIIDPKEFHKRTWGKSKEVDDERNFQTEHEAKTLVQNLTPQKNRDEIAEIKAQHPKLDSTHAFKNLEGYFRQMILAEFKNEFSTHAPELKEKVLAPILEKISPKLGTTSYEYQRLKYSHKPTYDLDFLLSEIENPVKVLLNLMGEFGNEKIAKKTFEFGNSNLITSFNIWKMSQSKVVFLPEYKTAELLEPPLVGKQKEVYKLKANPNKVLAKMLPGKNDYFKLMMEEIDMINILKDYKGLGVIAIDGITLHHGMPAMIMDYYPEHSKDFIAKTKDGQSTPSGYGDFDGQLIKMAKAVNKNTITKLLEIEKIMFEQKVRVKDLQFLINSEGTPVVADPGAIVKNTLPSKGEIGVIENLLATTVNKLLLEDDIDPKKEISENDLAAEIFKLTSIPIADIRMQAIMKLLIKRYKYNVAEDSKIKYTDTYKVREKTDKVITDTKDKPQSATEKIIAALLARPNFTIPWSELQESGYNPQVLGGVDYPTASDLILKKSIVEKVKGVGIRLKLADVKKLPPEKKILFALTIRDNHTIPWSELLENVYNPQIFFGVDYETAKAIIFAKKPIVDKVKDVGIRLKQTK